MSPASRLTLYGLQANELYAVILSPCPLEDDFKDVSVQQTVPVLD